MEEIVTILSTREWAITIWGTGFFIWMLTQSEIRKSLWNVIKILLGKNLRRFFLIIALYVAGITMIFYQLPFWNNIYLKDIILWLIFSGISYCVNSIIKGDTEHLKSTVKDNFKLIYIDSDILNQINMGKLKALNTVAESNIIKYFQERRILAKMEPHKLTYKMEFSESELKILSSTLRDMGYDDKEYTESQLKVLARNKERNLAILACLRQLQIDKKPTIVFACSVDHAKMLAAMLTLEGIPNSLVLGEMDVMDRKRAINIFKNRNSEQLNPRDMK